MECFDDEKKSDNIKFDGFHTICECTCLDFVGIAIARNILNMNNVNHLSTTLKARNIPDIMPDRHYRLKPPLLTISGSRIVKTISCNENTNLWTVRSAIETSKNTADIKPEQLEAVINYDARSRNYHWRLKIHHLEGTEGGGLIFGITDNSEKEFSEKLTMCSSLTSSSVHCDDYVDCYLDLYEQRLIFIRNGCHLINTININMRSWFTYRFCIQFIDAIGKVELIEYHESNWYIDNLAKIKTPNDINITRTPTEAICHAGLAMTRPLLECHHFVIALSLFPCYQRWIDGLIFSTTFGDDTDYGMSYQTAITYQRPGKGGDAVSYLARIYYSQGLYTGALNLLKLLNPAYIQKHKLYNAFAICLAVTGNKEESVKYLQNNDDLDDEKSGMYMDQIAFCYEDVDNNKAIEYYKSAIQTDNKVNTVEWIHKQLAALYAKMDDLENAKQSYLKIIELQPDDYSGYFDYAEYLKSFEKNTNESDIFYKQAVEMALKSAGGSEDAVLTVIDCYRALNKITLAIEYLKLYLENHDTDNMSAVAILKDCYITVGDYDNAILCLDKIFKTDPDVFEHNFEYAELLRVYDKDDSKSKIYYQKAIDIGLELVNEYNEGDVKEDDDMLSTVYDIISVCYEYLEEQENALRYALLAAEQKENDPVIANKVANLYYKQKNYENAKVWFLKAIDIGHDELDYLTFYDYAMCLQDLKQMEESKVFTRKSIEECLKTKEKREEADIEKDITEYIHISSCYVQLKEYKKVRKWLDQANDVIKQQNSANVSKFNDDLISEMYLNSALCYLLADKEYELALKDLLKIDDVMLKKCGLYAVASCIYRGLRDIEDAFKCCRTGLDAASDLNGIMIHMAMAFLLNERGDYDKADEHFNIALKIDKDQRDFELIESYSESLDHYTRDYDKSLFYANILRKIACDEAERCRAMIRLAIIHQHTDNIEEAVKCFNIALKHADNIDNELEYEHILQTFGYYCLITKQYESAYKHLFDAYTLDAKEPGITGLVGICLYEMNQKNDSIEYLEKSMADIIEKKDPYIGPTCIEYYANILFEQKEYEKCIELINNLIQRNDFNKYHENQDQIYYLQSRCWSKSANFDKALGCLMKANQLNPNRKLYINQIEMIKKIKVTDHQEY